MAFDGATVTVREANVATPLLDGISVGVLGGGFLGFSVAEETAFRLDFVDLQNSQGGGVLTGSYAYDPLNRRVHKQVNDGTQVTATAYVYDGWRCIEEWEATWPVGSQPQSPTYTLAAQYVHGGYIDELLVMRRDVDDNGSREEYFYHADDQFNIVAVTNASGTVVERYEYGPFGAPTILDPNGAVRTESAIGNTNLWNGREYDAETGLYYYRLRYLDPELGRFTTLDPIGLWGDPNNLGNGYAYVGNWPWTGLDPFGLYEVDFHYYATYYLLRARGHSAAETHRLAGFSQYVDDSFYSNPIINSVLQRTGRVRSHHFPGSNMGTATRPLGGGVGRSLRIAFSHYTDGDPNGEYLVGEALHRFADTFSHAGFTASHSTSINRREGSIRPNLGHADCGEGGHAVDRPYNDVEKALRAARAIFDRIPKGEGAQFQWKDIEGHLRLLFADGSGIDDEYNLLNRVLNWREAIERTFGEVPVYRTEDFSKDAKGFEDALREVNRERGVNSQPQTHYPIFGY